MTSDTTGQAATAAAGERHVRSRSIAAPPEAVFAVLTDPARHPETEPGDWVRAARDPEPLTEVGQVFGMDMYAEGAGGDYVMHSRVIALEPDRTVAWMPGRYDRTGAWGAGGWTWRYDLEPEGAGCRATLTYDWSAVPGPVRERFGGMPIFGPEFLEASLEALDAAVTGSSSPTSPGPASRRPAATDQAPTDQAPTDQAPTDQAPTDQASADQASAV